MTAVALPPVVSTVDVEGADLHVGDTIIDPVDGATVHLIADLTEHPDYRGDHARRAHETVDWRADGGWGATILDHHTYHRLVA